MMLLIGLGIGATPFISIVKDEARGLTGASTGVNIVHQEDGATLLGSQASTC